MGTSTDAKLCYGIAVGYGSSDHSIVARFFYSEDSDNHKLSDLYDKYQDNIVYHCSSSYEMFIIAAAESQYVARRGSPIELGECINSEHEWNDEIREVCTALGVEYRQPQWLLCSYWG